MTDVDVSFLRKYPISQLTKLAPDDVYLLIQLVSHQSMDNIRAEVQARTGVVAEAITSNPTATPVEILKGLEPWLDKAIGG